LAIPGSFGKGLLVAPVKFGAVEILAISPLHGSLQGEIVAIDTV